MLTRSLTIGIVCPYGWDTPGGVQNHVRDLAVRGAVAHKVVQKFFQLLGFTRTQHFVDGLVMGVDLGGQALHHGQTIIDQ